MDTREVVDCTGDRLANDLIGRTAEHRSGRRVPGRDDTAQVLADNRVVRRLDNGRKLEARFVPPRLRTDVTLIGRQ